MKVILVGLNHKTAPVEIREQVAFDPARLPDLAATLRNMPAIEECAILSTCNRSEMYAATQDATQGSNSLIRFLGTSRSVPVEVYRPHLYQNSGYDAVNHLFRVASGLDSMILGENQILGQVRQAYSIAQQAQSCGPILGKLFPWAIRVGKLARSQTKICQGASSVAAAAVELAQAIFGDLKGRKLLLLGAGKMSRKALKLLVHAGVERVSVANRTFAKAEQLAQQCGGEAVPFEMLDDALIDIDVMLTSTGAPHFVVTKDRLKKVMRKRRGKPLFLVDIAVPRDIEPSCQELDNVYLYNIDDLQHAVNQNLARRHKEISKVLTIVDEHTKQFIRYLDGRRASGAIKKLRDNFDYIRNLELERFLKQHGVTPEQKKLLERFSRGLINKLLHQPTTQLRRLGEAGVEPDELNRSLETLGLSSIPEAHNREDTN